MSLNAVKREEKHFQTACLSIDVFYIFSMYFILFFHSVCAWVSKV